MIGYEEDIHTPYMPEPYYQEEDEYDDEYYEDEYYSDDEEEESIWPKVQRKTPLPPVDFLIKHAPKQIVRPSPMEASFVKKMEDYKANLKSATEEKERIESQYNKFALELEQEKVASSTGNKWTNRGQREAVLKRLNSDLDLLAPKLAQARKKVEEIQTSGEVYVKLFKASENVLKCYEEYIVFQHASWKKVYGHHTPFNTTEKFRKYYEVVGEPEVLDSGLTRFTLKNDYEVSHCVRELKMGGHEFAQMDHWTSILLDTEELKKFDSK